MLVLTRNPGQRIMVGDNVTLEILNVFGSQVSVGIKAPKDIPVHREEIYNRISQEKQIIEAEKTNEAMWRAIETQTEKGAHE